jgi:diguanylate cyclase (GGDEF)-like protein/putative nucleotidyltransferase with HDIG domain
MQIEYLNSYDQITKLHNRRFFDEQLEQLDVVNLLPLGVIFADVNGLKIINDSFGHSAGDQLLKKCAGVLQKFGNETSKFARIGGDEFAMVLPKTTKEEIERIVLEISQNCEKESVNMLPLSVSCGWAIKENITQPMREILKAAEDMMYKKKMFEAPSRRGKTIEVIISTLHEKNPREEQHSQRVADLCTELANALALSNHEKLKIKSAGLLHDIGKIGIPEVLLNKPGKLTTEEYQTICKHPEIGYRILQYASDMGEIAEIILAHHERWDGLGYPRGLKGEEIPYISRMVAIADTYDAMTSVRSYRMPLSEKDAAQEIINNAGTQFDPDLAYRFVYDILNTRVKDEL